MTASTTPAPTKLRLIDRPDLLKARLRASPDAPGVYVMRDVEARVIYVGKASRLRARLRSYFTGLDTLAPRTAHLVDRVFDFDTIACANEREALILENTLIKRYRPRFNIRLRDDKNYLYLKIPQPGSADTLAPGTAREAPRSARGRNEGPQPSDYPRPYYSRKLSRDGARYFGPYTNANALRSTVRSLRTVFPFRTCGDEIFRRGQVCLDYHIKRCAGPCEGRVDPEAYAELLDNVELFLNGDSAGVEKRFREQMDAASERLEFEVAAGYRDRLEAARRIAERQKMVAASRTDEDVVALAVSAGRAMVAVLAVRDGRVNGLENHELEGIADMSAGECLSAFVAQYYGSAPTVPRTVLLSDVIADADVIADFLASQRGGPVDVRSPSRGRGRGLVDQARESAEAALRQRRIVEDFDSDKTAAILEDLALRLDLEAPPQRIECYDISNTMGTNSVGSMVVFEDGRPKNAHYRHFTIKTVEGSDDFRSMQETLRRRFARYLAEHTDAGDIPVEDPDGSNGAPRRGNASKTGEGGDGGRVKGQRRDDSFGILPDLIIIDGGKGQLGAAHAVLVEAGLESVAIFGLAKREEELFRPGVAEPTLIPKDSPTLFLVQRVRDEAHRFAITNHRAKRGKAALRSRLDVVTGLGPVRKRALLRQFGSVDGIREASLEELMALPEIPRSLALRLKELL